MGFIAIIGFFVGCCAVSPLLKLVLQGIEVRVVIVYRNQQAVGGRVAGKNQVIDGQLGTGNVAGYAQIALAVVAAGSTYGIHKHLVPSVERGVLLAVVVEVGPVAPSDVVDLVHAFENKEVSFVLKFPGNLGPHGRQLFFYRLIYLRVGGGVFNVEPIFAVGPVVVNVDDGIQACMLGIVHQFGYTVEPVAVDGIIGGWPHFAQPGDGYAHGGKAGFGQFIEGGLRCGLVAPNGFVGRSVGMSVELIAQVPSHAQRAGHCQRFFGLVALLSQPKVSGVIASQQGQLGLPGVGAGVGQGGDGKFLLAFAAFAAAYAVPVGFWSLQFKLGVGACAEEHTAPFMGKIKAGLGEADLGCEVFFFFVLAAHEEDEEGGEE